MRERDSTREAGGPMRALPGQAIGYDRYRAEAARLRREAKRELGRALAAGLAGRLAALVSALASLAGGPAPGVHSGGTRRR